MPLVCRSMFVQRKCNSKSGNSSHHHYGSRVSFVSHDITPHILYQDPGHRNTSDFLAYFRIPPYFHHERCFLSPVPVRHSGCRELLSRERMNGITRIRLISPDIIPGRVLSSW